MILQIIIWYMIANIVSVFILYFGDDNTLNNTMNRILKEYGNFKILVYILFASACAFLTIPVCIKLTIHNICKQIIIRNLSKHLYIDIRWDPDAKSVTETIKVDDEVVDKSNLSKDQRYLVRDAEDRFFDKLKVSDEDITHASVEDIKKWELLIKYTVDPNKTLNEINNQ